MTYHRIQSNTSYMKDILTITTKLELENLQNWRKELECWERTQVTDELTSKISLIAVDIPTKWWTLEEYVDGSEDASIIASVRAGKAELGNRDFLMAAYGGADINGHLKVCRVCDSKSLLNEQHVIMCCRALTEVRKTLRYEGQTLQNWINTTIADSSIEEAFRLLLSPRRLNRHNRYILADILSNLLTEHKIKWTEKLSEPTNT